MSSVIYLASLGIITLFAGVYQLRRALVPIVTFGLLGLLAVLFMEWNAVTPWFSQFQSMVSFDKYAIAFSAIMIVATLMIVLVSTHAYRNQVHDVGDILGLMLFALCGGVIMTSYNNLSMLFLGIEILSIPLYILAGSKKQDLASNEASIKYFLMGAFSTGFLLLGIALIYGSTHSFDMQEIAAQLTNPTNFTPMFGLGVMLVSVAMIFKVSGVPFHFWAPDVYQGAPTTITAFMSTVVKIAGFAAFFRLLYMWFGDVLPAQMSNILWIVAALTLIVGTLSALMQSRVKRMLAYSGISNAGFLMIALVSRSHFADSSLLYYALSYAIATIMVFTVLILVEDARGNDDYDSFKGIIKSNPLLAVLLSVAMLSLAGIPPLAGFFGKYYLIRTALEYNYFWLVVIALASSLVAIAYYFRLMIAAVTVKEGTDYPRILIHPMAKLVLIIGAVSLLLLGLFPETVTNLLLPFTV